MAAVTGAVLGGLAAATSIAGGVMSLTDVKHQAKLQEDANKAQKEAIAEARKANSVNYFANLGINNQVYTNLENQNTSMGAQAINAVTTGDERGAAAGVGNIYQAATANNAQIAAQKNQDIINNQQKIAAEDSRIAGVNASLSAGAAQGAALASRDAQEQMAADVTQGVGGLAKGFTGAVNMVPLYMKWKKGDFGDGTEKKV
jgi:hypothetical protein